MFRAWKRQKIARQPFPPEWREALFRHVSFFHDMNEEDRAKLEFLTKHFVAERNWIAGGDIEITPVVQAVIGAAASRLVMDLGINAYNRLTEVVVYPAAFFNPLDEEGRCGEAHSWGVVVLGWREVLEGLADPRDGYNPAFHEFAHVLDRSTGEFNGTPPLRSRADYAEWGTVMAHHYEALREGDLVHQDVLDDYGAENEVEFFAVASETYFERGYEMQRAFPDLYGVLDRYYNAPP